jgi:hypothetical protein
MPVVATLAIYALQTHHIPAVGDEPHYVMIADSLAHDFDFDVRNNYEQDVERRAIVGRIRPHVRFKGEQWVSYHAPGLGVLLAVPFLVGGIHGCRVALVILTGILPFALYHWFRRTLSKGTAVWLAASVAASVPILFGSILIYPDLTAGVVATPLVAWVIARAAGDPASGVEWAAFWSVAGLLPWLNLKFAPTTLIVTSGAVAALIHQHWHGVRQKAAWISLPLVAVGPLALAFFNLNEFGQLLGPRGTSELTSSPMRALLIFLGLHFDQSQGMFLQQPLLLIGVSLLVPFAREMPWTAVFWVMAYLSLIAPNAFELARFGMAGPDGRFGWSAEWLWMLPLGVLRTGSPGWERWLRRLCMAGIVYQVLLAIRWLPYPLQLFPHLQESLADRDSLFPIWLRGLMPSYYLWDFKRFLTYPPNVAATFAAAGVLVGGAIWWRRTNSAPSA